MTQVMPFQFEGQNVRVLNREGVAWWVLTDVCGLLGHSNPSVAGRRLDDDEKDTLNIGEGIRDGGVFADGRAQSVVLINESGLWSLVLTSRKPAAKRFKKWVTGEVIPSIRRTGAYVASSAGDTSETLMARAVLAAQEALQRKDAELVALAPKALAYDRIAGMDGLLTLTEAAKECGWPPRRFMARLHEMRWIYRAGNKSRWIGYADKERAGYLSYKHFEQTHPEGHLVSRPQVVLTLKGLARIAQILPAQEEVV
ncbi:prophage antirepressor-like protein [Gluconobacter cerinus]|uniref:phage antirepressor n=1 Tax=Gluconobacter cerinus TaxID=38307 RepID=UPI002225DB69|nr:phage antirepressor KilAC domain-containing protein [Gluconobacter cerinus]MCW2265323.1 prophage antirepressor-like protein [Gluconobacter cerinus]